MSSTASSWVAWPLCRRTLSAKLAIAATVLCVLCVAATGTVMGIQTSRMASEQADEHATLAAREAAGHPPSREQLDAMARRVLEVHTEFIGTIDGIAFQTNILALNAAVDAARAGKQGRGHQEPDQRQRRPRHPAERRPGGRDGRCVDQPEGPGRRADAGGGGVRSPRQVIRGGVWAASGPAKIRKVLKPLARPTHVHPHRHLHRPLR